MFRLHVIFLRWWVISGSVSPEIFISMLVTDCATGTDSRINSTTALFGLNIDNLAKYSFSFAVLYMTGTFGCSQIYRPYTCVCSVPD